MVNQCYFEAKRSPGGWGGFVTGVVLLSWNECIRNG